MSQDRLFTIIGDSNVSRNMTPFNVRDRPGLSDAQVLSCSKLQVMPDALRSARAASNIIIVACITNMLTASEEAGSIAARVGPILREFRAHLDAFCASRVTTLVAVSPPMYRILPHWFSVGLPEILIEFSACMSANRPANLHLINSFSTPELQPDGVHLSLYSGLRYVVHLFDAARAISEAPAPPQELAATTEAIRVVTDRVVVLEQGHALLAADFALKTAVDAELDEYHENVRYEDCFLISGLPGPDSGLGNRDWQNSVKRMVQEKIQLIIGRQAPISYVQNATGARKDGVKVFLVKMVNLVDSKAIRDKFGSFFKAGAAPRHPGSYFGYLA